MKAARRFSALLAVGLAITPLFAADATPPAKGPPVPSPSAPATPHRKTEVPTEAPTSMVTPLRMHRVAPILGREINAASGERIGRLRDFAVELPSGRVGYAVVERDAAFASKLIAVPPAALTWRTNDTSLLLSVDAARVRNAPGFDDAHWPSISSPAWGAGVLSRNPIQGTNEAASAERIEQEGKGRAPEKQESDDAKDISRPIDRATTEGSIQPPNPRSKPRIEKPDRPEPPQPPNRPEKEPPDAVTSPELPSIPNVEQKPTAPPPDEKTQEPPQPNEPKDSKAEQSESGSAEPPTAVRSDVPERLARVSELIGATVKSSGDEKLGDITDVIVDMNAGRLAFAVLALGALAEGTEKLVAVPVELLSSTRERRVLRLDADKTLLVAGAGFNSQTWPDFSNETFAAEVFRRFEAKPYWETGRSVPPTNPVTKGIP